MSHLVKKTRLLLLILSVLLVVDGHPAPAPVLCHGFQPAISYVYKYTTSMRLNNNDHQVRHTQATLNEDFEKRRSLKNLAYYARYSDSRGKTLISFNGFLLSRQS